MNMAMKKHLIVIGIIILLLIVGLSGFINQTYDYNESYSNGKDKEVTQYDLEEIIIINNHTTSIDVYVETRTNNGSSIKKSFYLDSYSIDHNYSKNIYIREEGLLSGENVLVIVTALEKNTNNISDMILNSSGYKKIEFLFNSDGTIEYRRK